MSMAKKITSIIMAGSLIVGSAAATTGPGQEAVAVEGNFVKISTSEDFARGGSYNLQPVNVGDGALQLSEGETEGEFLSQVYSVQAFNDLVLSWNTDTPPSTYAEFFARVWIPDYDGWTDPDGNQYDGWSDWITFGTWSPFVRRECPDQNDTHPRKDSDDQNGWAFAYSYTGAGDSSLNVRGDFTATKFQIMAKLYATHDAVEQPVLRLLAATWKNTNDTDWWDACTYSEETVAQKDSVKLDTPGISQGMRDPEYGGVICSSTSITMLLCGQGTDVLPEDVSLIGFDYGFGGNGNWSFSVAAAGAYGHESYVHYASFEGLRQELSKGYAAALSVKYSNSPGGRYPYLENAPTTTGGHLITVVGYYFSEELGEYVYYCNDPAARPDEKVAYREYRESQLSEAWYRRAAYFVHGKEDGAGDWSRIRETGLLLPVKDMPDTYALVTDDGELVKLPEAFLRGKRKAFDFRGSLCLTVENDQKDIAEGTRRVAANDNFYYDQAVPGADGFVEFNEGVLDEIYDEGNTVTLYVISNDGYMYTMLGSKDNPVYDPVTGKVVSSVQETASTQPEQPQTTAPEATQPAGKPLTTGVIIPIIIGAGAAIAAVGVVAFLRWRKKK